jgi:isopentenyl-diphosphate delta-isomerase
MADRPPRQDSSSLLERKDEHLDLAATGDVSFRGRTTLLEQVGLVHDALPELARDEIDLGTTFLGKTLRAPLIIAAMTGGTPRATTVNRELASVAEELGIGFGFGSMRPLLEKGSKDGYFVRDVAPNALLLGNIGVVQAGRASDAALADLVGSTGCDALCVHLNPAMEIIQAGGDDDFRGGLDTIARLVRALPVPILVKETGCGLSRSVGQRLASVGVRWVDVSGAGGTSWVGVETLRARARNKALGELFWDWGIPTAASVVQLDGLGLGVVATGGVSSGLDVARALALGATAGGIARRFLKAQVEGGRAGVLASTADVIEELRVACLLTGCRTPAELRDRPVVLGPELSAWVPADAPIRTRSAREETWRASR